MKPITSSRATGSFIPDSPSSERARRFSRVERRRTAKIAAESVAASVEELAVTVDKNARGQAAVAASVQEVLRDTGALAAVETVIAELTTAARGALKHAPTGVREARDALLALTERATQRAH